MAHPHPPAPSLLQARATLGVAPLLAFLHPRHPALGGGQAWPRACLATPSHVAPAAAAPLRSAAVITGVPSASPQAVQKQKRTAAGAPSDGAHDGAKPAHPWQRVGTAAATARQQLEPASLPAPLPPAVASPPMVPSLERGVASSSRTVQGWGGGTWQPPSPPVPATLLSTSGAAPAPWSPHAASQHPPTAPPAPIAPTTLELQPLGSSPRSPHVPAAQLAAISAADASAAPGMPRRAAALARYREKRGRRQWGYTVRYQCRKVGMSAVIAGPGQRPAGSRVWWVGPLDPGGGHVLPCCQRCCASTGECNVRSPLRCAGAKKGMVPSPHCLHDCPDLLFTRANAPHRPCRCTLWYAPASVVASYPRKIFRSTRCSSSTTPMPLPVLPAWTQACHRP